MLTRKSPQQLGIEGTAPFYNFFARLERAECDTLRQAQDKARNKMGGTPSNGLFLMEILNAYLRGGK